MRLRRFIGDATVERGRETARTYVTADFTEYNETTVTRTLEDCQTAPCLPPVMYEPDGFHRECKDFPKWLDAYLFVQAAEDMAYERHDLDIDGRGSPCNKLPGAPEKGEPLPDISGGL